MSDCESAAEGRGVVTGMFRGRNGLKPLVGRADGDDTLIFEGDILMRRETLAPPSTLELLAEALNRLRFENQDPAVRKAIRALEELAFPDGNLEGATVLSSGLVWRDRTVPYVIDAGLIHRERVTDAIAHWEQQTSLRFRKRNGEADYLAFIPSNGCRSFVGRQGGRQAVHVGPACSTGNCIHEIGHSIGLWHEQSRVDRDTHVRIVWDNVQPAAHDNFVQMLNETKDAGAYDFASIMHYPLTAFAIDRTKPTIVPLADVTGIEVGQRKALSAIDKTTVEELYAAEGKPQGA